MYIFASSLDPMTALDMDIEQTYKLIKEKWEKHLRSHGVKLPRLMVKGGEYSKDALVLVYLAREYPDTVWVTKEELTESIKKYYSKTPDVQSGRHLGAQKGFYILSSRRGNNYPTGKPPPRGKAAYLLLTLEEPHPSLRSKREGKIAQEDFEEIKKKYDYRCATCGSKEGESNYRYPGSVTELQKAHRNPHEPLEGDNIIPQCQFCNRPDRNKWVYDKRGRVVGVASVWPILKSIKKGWLPTHEIEKLKDAISSYLRSRERESGP